MRKICSMSQPQLKTTLVNYLKEKYGFISVVEVGECILAQGNIPVALVAHMDTVFKVLPSEVYFDPKAQVMWSPQGLGADDRAGIYAIIQIIEKGYRPHIIFTSDEEIGGIGASKLVKECNKHPFGKLKYLIELDRRGVQDSVFYDCDNKQFESYINSFGFKTDWGSFSDISILAPEWGIAAVNLSIGYESEHSQTERLFCRAIERTIRKVCLMLEDADKVSKFVYIERKHYYTWRNNRYNLDGVDRCDWCATELSDKGTNTINTAYGEMCLCDDCLKAWLEWD